MDAPVLVLALVLLVTMVIRAPLSRVHASSLRVACVGDRGTKRLIRVYECGAELNGAPIALSGTRYLWGIVMVSLTSAILDQTCHFFNLELRSFGLLLREKKAFSE